MKASEQSDFISTLIGHPLIRADVSEFVTALLHQALAVEEIRTEVISALSCQEIVDLVERVPVQAAKDEKTEVDVIGRRQITARDAAKILGYNPRYFSRKSKDWGLTKIRMSRTTCRYYLDEIEQLATERGIRASA